MKSLPVVIAFGLAMLLAGCGSSAPRSTTSPSADASASATTRAPDLKAELLVISDLPAGDWSVVRNTTSGATPSCFAVVRSDLDLKAATQAQVTFIHGSNSLPVFEELLAYLPGRGQSSMTAATHVISGCGHISLTLGGQNLTGVVRPVSFPAVGDQSAAYQLSLSGTVSGQPVTLGVDAIIFRKGDIVATIQYVDLGPPLDITALEQITQLAAAKVS